MRPAREHTTARRADSSLVGKAIRSSQEPLLVLSLQSSPDCLRPCPRFPRSWGWPRTGILESTILVETPLLPIQTIAAGSFSEDVGSFRGSGVRALRRGFISRNPLKAVLRRYRRDMDSAANPRTRLRIHCERFRSRTGTDICLRHLSVDA